MESTLKHDLGTLIESAADGWIASGADVEFDAISGVDEYVASSLLMSPLAATISQRLETVSARDTGFPWEYCDIDIVIGVANIGRSSRLQKRWEAIVRGFVAEVFRAVQRRGYAVDYGLKPYRLVQIVDAPETALIKPS